MSERFLCLTAAEADALRQRQPADAEVRAAARRLALLGEPNRVRIALVLRDVGELCVGDSAALLGLPVTLVSHHVRALAAAGLAEKRRDGKLVRYRLTPLAVDLLEIALAAEPTGS